MSQLMRNNRELYRDLYNANNNPKPQISYKFIGRSITEERLSFLKRYMRLIIETNIVCPFTKQYIFDGSSVTSIVNRMLREGEDVNIHTAYNKVNYDSKKLNKYFTDEHMLCNVAYSLVGGDKGKALMQQYVNELNIASARYYKRNTLSKNLALTLSTKPICESITQDEFESLLKTLQPYSLTNMENAAKALSENQIGYYNHMLRAKSLNDTDRERYNKLLLTLEPKQS
ncbi:MAG: hypothetical protein RR576_06280 [Oscillospiraceae bacterium]